MSIILIILIRLLEEQSCRYTDKTVNFDRLTSNTCADQESFFRGGPTFVFLFLVEEGRRVDPNITINGPSAARHRNAIKMVFRCREDDGPH